MSKHYHSVKSLEDLNDRELLLFILSNQVNLFRQTQYLMNAIKGKEHEPLGLYANTFKELVQDVDDILEQAEEYMSQSNEDKGFLRF